MIDIKNPTKPRLMSMFPLPVPPADAPYTNFLRQRRPLSAPTIQISSTTCPMSKNKAT